MWLLPSFMRGLGSERPTTTIAQPNGGGAFFGNVYDFRDIQITVPFLVVVFCDLSTSPFGRSFSGGSEASNSTPTC